MARILVTKEDRYQIYYDPSRREFSADVDGNEVAIGPTQLEVERLAKKLVKGQFKRIPAIYVAYQRTRLVEITSLATGGYGGSFCHVWIVTEGNREKVVLSDLYQRTDKNMGIATQIEKKKDYIQTLRKEIEVLVEGLEKPITKENILILAGVEKEKEV